MRIAVVGAGWAGLGAAIRLVDAGHRVTVFDAAQGAGGRARGIRTAWQAGDDGTMLSLDNGQHLVIGAYTELLALLDRIGTGESTAFERSRFRLDDGHGFRIPAPGVLGLLLATGLSWPVRGALSLLLARSRRDRQAVVRDAEGHTVEAWCRRGRQPAELLDRLWRPLVVSAMNTPVDRACAATFVNVLADSLCGSARATDFLVPHATLSTAFVEPAVAWLRRAGAATVFGADIRGIAGEAGRYRLLLAGDRAAGPEAGGDGRGAATGADPRFDGIVIATPPGVAARLLGRSMSDAADAPATVPPAARPVVDALGRFGHRPITTVYVGWREPAASASGDRWTRLPVATLLHDDAAAGRHGQWLFRRPSQAGWRIGGVVISNSVDASALPREELAGAVARQLLAQLGLAPPQAHAVFHDRRATIDCVPDRPRIATAVPGADRIVLAGDYQYDRYPATLEAALRSGRDAAAQIASIA